MDLTLKIQSITFLLKSKVSTSTKNDCLVHLNLGVYDLKVKAGLTLKSTARIFRAEMEK